MDLCFSQETINVYRRMRKGLLRKRISIVRNLLKSILLFVGLFVFGGGVVGQDVTATIGCAGNEIHLGAELTAQITNGTYASNGYWSFGDGLNVSPVNDPDAAITGFSGNNTVYNLVWTGTTPSGNNPTPYTVELTVIEARPTSVSFSPVGSTNICTGGSVNPQVQVTVEGGLNDSWIVPISDGSSTNDYVITDTDGNGIQSEIITIGAISTTTTYEVMAVRSSLSCVYSGSLPAPVTFTVQTPPVAQPTSGTSVCSTENLDDIVLQNSESGVDYYVVYDDGISTSEVSGTRWTSSGGPHPFPAINEGVGAYYVVADGCNGTVPMNGGPFYISSAPATTPSLVSASPACPGSDLVVNNTEGSDVRYHLLLAGSRTGAYRDGNNGTRTFGGLSTPGVYTVEAERNGCVVTLSGSFEIQAAPSAFDLTANKSSYCAGASPTGVQLTLSDTEAGIEYQLQHDDGSGFSDLGSSVSGNGNPFSPANWGDLIEGTYRVIATSTAGCPTTMNGTPVIVESTPPSATISTSTPNSRCEGESVDFYINVSLSGAQPFSFDITNNAGDPPISVSDHYSKTYSIPVTPSTDITYTLTNLVDGSACIPVSNVGQVQFFVHPNPVFTFGASPNSVSTSGVIPSTSVCRGSQVTLDANVSNTSGPYLYNWSNSLGTSQQVSFYPNTTRIYDATVENEFGCSSTRQIEVVVNSLPVLDFEPENGDYDVCINGGDVELIPAVPTGGNFTGTGVSGNFFDPVAANVGRHPITYTFTNTTTGCENSITKDIDVNPEPNVNAQSNPTDFCAGVGVVDINGYPQNSNGVWTIVGGSRPWFWDDNDGTASLDVDLALNNTGGGTFDLVYQYTEGTTNCVGQDILTVNLHPDLNNELEFEYRAATAGVGDPWFPFPAGDLTMCQTGDVIELQGIFDASGTLVGNGTFYGAGVTDTGSGTAEFNPAIAGNGNHTITYTYTDPITTCTGTVTHTVQIGTSLEFPGLNSLYCATDGPVDVYADDTAGSGISGSLEVFDNSNPSIPVSIYTQLSNSSSNTFTFDPSTDPSFAPGVYLFRFTYNDGTCDNILDQEVTVAATLDPSFTTASGLTQFCETQGPVQLVPSQSGGVFSVANSSGTAISAISGYYFNPSASAVTPGETYTITYTINTGSCSASSTLDVTVVASPSIAISGLAAEYCDDETGPFLIEPNNPDVAGAEYTFSTTVNAIGRSPLYYDDGTDTIHVSAQTFTAPYSEKFYFDPAHAGYGIYTVTYTFDNSANTGCVASVSQVVTVNETRAVNFGGPADPIEYCQSDAPVTLQGSFVGGGFTGEGNFFGNGIDNLIADDGVAEFDPSSVTPGDHPIRYEYVNTTTGCSSERTKTFTVEAAPSKYTVQGGGAFCSSAASGPEVTLSGSQNNSDLEYELLLNGLSLNPRVPETGDGSPITFPPQSADGTYTVIAINTVTGCISEMTGSVEITKNEVALTVDDFTNVSCTGAMDGTITATASGGSAPYLYSLYSDAGLSTLEADNNNGIFEFLGAGTYYLQVEDAIGCELSSPVEVTITQPANPLTVDTDSSPVGCSGCTAGTTCEGAAWINISGGTAFADLTTYPSGYNIEWKDNAGTTVTSVAGGTRIEQQSAGSYTVTVTDAKGCTVSEVIDIETVDAITLTEVSRTHVDCYGSATGRFTVQAAGGDSNADYQFSLDQNNWFGPDVTDGAQRTFENLSADTYDVYVRDANYPRCETQLGTSIVISEPDKLDVYELPGSHVNVNCYGDDTGAFEVEADGGSGVYTFSLNGGTYAAADLFTDLVAGSYSVTVQDAEGCTASLANPVEITHSPDLTIIDYDVTDASCNLGNDGEITITAKGGDGNYVYSLTDGTDTWAAQASATFGGLNPGSYNATVTDGNSCVATYNGIEVDDPDVALTLTHNVDQNVLCRGGSSGEFTVTASGGSGGYEFSIDGGATWDDDGTNSYSWDGQFAGTYTVDVRDAKGCTTDESVTITQPATSFTLSGVVDNHVSCHGDSDASITVDGEGGTSLSAVNYVLYKEISGSWIIQDSESNNTGDAETFTGLDEGEYKVEAWDSNGCTDDVSLTITEPSTAINITSTISNVTTVGGNDGSIEIEITDGSGTYPSIIWTGTDESGTDISSGLTDNVYLQPGLEAGTYYVTVTDGNGCTVTSDPMVVTDPDSDLGLSISTGEPGFCSGATNGTISITATGGVPPYASITLTRGGVEESKTTSGNDYATYTDLGEGTYVAEVEDDAGNVYTENIVFTLPDPFGLNFSIDRDATCNGESDGTITFSASEGTPEDNGTPADDTDDFYNYFITPPSGVVIPGQLPVGGSVTISTLAFGNGYKLEVHDANGCFVDTDFNIDEPEPISFGVDPKNLTCYESGDGSITLENVTGGWGNGYTYDWDRLDETTTPATWVVHEHDGNQSVNNLLAGTYRVTVTGNLNNCEAISSNIVITQPEELELILGGQENVTTCYGDNSGSVTLRVEGGTANYDLTGSATQSNWDGVDTYSATGLYAGTNTFNVLDSKGCVADVTTDILQPEEMVVSGVSADIECEPADGGELEIEISGGRVNTSGNYAYRVGLVNQTTGNSLVSIHNVADTETAPFVIDVSAIPPGDYDLTVSDANSTDPSGCVYEDVISLSYIDVQADITDVTCVGAADGAIDITVSGGSGNYTYLWSDDGGTTTYATTQDLSGLSKGTYELTVTDTDRGCTLTTLEYPVEHGKTLVIDASVSPVSCNGGGNGAILIDEVVGASLTITYYLDGVEDTDNDGQWTGLSAGTYEVTVVDGDGCVATKSFYVSHPLAINFSLRSSLDCSVDYDRTIELYNFSGGIAPYSYTWSGPGGFTEDSDTEISDITVGGTYSVQVTDDRNCSVTRTIDVPGKPVLTADVTAVQCNGGDNGVIDLSVTGGSNDYTYLWNDAAASTTQDLSGLEDGTYEVTVTDESQICEVSGVAYFESLEVEVTEPDPIIVDSYVSDVTCNGAQDGEINITSISGGAGSYTLTWDVSPYLTTGAWQQTDLPGGMYSVVVSSGGCNITRIFTVDEDDPLDFTLNRNDSNCDQENSLTISSPVGGTGSYEYVWAGPGVDNSDPALTTQTNLPGGEYTVTMVDVGNAHNCHVTKTATLTQPLEATYTTQAETCPGANNGAVNISVNNGVAPYNYSWTTTDGSGLVTSDEDQSGLSAGNYEVVITDSNPDGPCSVTLSDIEVVAANTISVSSNITDVRCYGSSTGAINIDVTGGSEPYTYDWQGPGSYTSSAGNISDLAAGSYILNVTNEISGVECAVTEVFEVNQPADFMAVTNVAVDSAECKGSATGSIDITVEGGTAPYRFQWVGPGTIPDATLVDIEDVQAGDYNVIITDANDCVLDYNATYGSLIKIPEPAEVLDVSLIDFTHVTTYPNGSDGSIEVEVTGGAGSYTIRWFDENDDPVPGSDNLEVVDNLPAGTYRVFVSDEHACSDEIRNIPVSEPNATLGLIVSKRNVGPCNSVNNGEITVDMIGGTLPYQSITLFDGSGQVEQVVNDNNAVFDELPAGDYEVVGIDANDVEVRENITLLQPSALQLNASVTQQVECYQSATGIIQVSVNGGVAQAISGNYSVTLSGGPAGTGTSYSPISGEVFTFDNLPAGTYTVRVIDDSNINEVDASINTYTAGYGNGSFNMNSDCYLEQQVEVIQPEAELILSTLTGSEEICENSSPTLQLITANWDFAVNGNLEVALSDGETYIVDSSPFTFLPNAVPSTGITQYSIVSVEDALGCSKGTGSGIAKVEVHPLPTATIFGDADLCVGDSRNLGIELTGTSPWDVTISDGTNTWNQTYTESFNLFSVSPAETATYEILTVSDAHCSNSGTGNATLTVNQLPEVTLSGDAEICEGESTNLTFEFTAGTGPWTVTFTENEVERTVGPVATTPYTLAVSPSETTDYALVSLYDNEGCTQDVSGNVRVTVREKPDQPEAITGDDIVCQGSTHTYSVEPVANAIGYVWTLPPGATIVQGDGTRQIEVEYATDAETGNLSVYAQNSCDDPGPNRTIQINVDKLPQSIGAISGPQDLCQGATGVSYSVTPVPDASQYNWTVPTGFSITSGQGTAKIVVELDPALDATIGNITVTPENGCGISTSMEQLEVEVHPLPQADAGSDQQLCENFTTLDAIAPASVNSDWEGAWTIVSGYAQIAFLNNPASAVTNISRGDVVLRWTVTNTATSGNGCSVSDEVTIRNNRISVIADAEKTLTCDGTSELYATPVPEYANTEGRWSFEDGSGIFEDATSPTTIVSDLAPGSNTLKWTITQNTCESSGVVEIINDQPDQAVINDQDIIDLCGTDTTLTANNPAEGTGEWSVEKGRATITATNADGNEITVTNLAKGENIIRWTITKNGNCSTYDEVTIRNNQLEVDAGDSYITCETMVALDATPAPEGATGQWTALGDSAGNVLFADGNSHQTEISNLINGDNRLQWTLYQNGCESSDEVIITSHAPTQAIVGSNQTICKNDTVLSGNTPEDYETGRWSVVQGSGRFEDLNEPETRVSGIGNGVNIYRWTIFNGNCSTSDDLTVVNNQVVAFAGKDTVTCDQLIDLKAQPAPEGYTGFWTVVPGEGSVTWEDPNTMPKATVKLGYGSNQLVWTVVHEASGCTSSDEVNILVNAIAVVEAGGDQEINSGSGETTLAAELPDRAIGQWSIISGGGTFIDPTDPTTRVVDLEMGPNIFLWTVTIGDCSASDQVTITNGDVIQAETDPDFITCSADVQLGANDSGNAIGHWTLGSYGSGDIVDDDDPNTMVRNLGPGDNEFVWTISYGPGTPSTSDVIVVTNNKPDDARPKDGGVTCDDSFLLEGNQPDAGMGTVSWSIISGGGDIADVNAVTTEVTNLMQGENRFVYSIRKGVEKVCFSTDTITVINGTPTTPDAGDDKTLCTDSVMLEPNVPNHGIGEWRILEGGAEFDGNMARRISPGVNRFLWVISTESCSLQDTVTIVNNEPSVANAGDDRPVCENTVVLSGSLPTRHTGEWTRISGTGDILNPTEPDAEVENLGQGENKFRWTITNGQCSDWDDVIIRNDFKEAKILYLNPNPICVDTVALRANNPAPGVGTWGVIGGSGSASFDDPSNPNTIVRDLAQGENILTWTVQNGHCTDVATVTIVNNMPTDADAGGNFASCDNFVTLSANTPMVGNGTWTVRNGSGDFVDDNNPNTQVSGLNFGANVFRWTIVNEGCSSFDDVQVDFNSIEPEVGDDRTVCSDTEVLQAANAAPGTGTWTVAGGTSQATFDNINEPGTTVRNLRKGVNRLKWTVNYKGCQTTEEVSITNASPSTAYAGNTDRKCANETVLDALQPEIGTGRWEVISGSATIADSDANNPKAPVTNIAKGENVLRWVVENGICRSTDDVLVVNNLPSTPFAGSDLTVCEPNHDLMAATPEYGEGFWSIVEGGGNISDVTDPRAKIKNLAQGRNILKWTVSHGQCTLFDEIVITNNTASSANAGPDVADCKDWSQLDANPPLQGVGEWYIVSGIGTFDNAADESSVIRDLGFGENILMWEIWNGTGENRCFSRDTVVIFNKVPAQSNAGNDKEFCDNYTTLNANLPPEGAVGSWTVVSGAGDFESPNSNNSIVRDIGFGNNVYKWTISYDDCVTESTVTIKSNKTDAYAGEDVVVYDPEAMLNANNVGELNAIWTLVGGAGEFDDPTFFNPLVTGLNNGINTFRWIIEVEGCTSYDDVSVEYRPVPDAGFITDNDEGCWPMDVLFTNYSVGVQNRDYHWDFGDGNFSGDQNPQHTFEVAGNYSVTLTVPGPDGIEGRYQKIIRVHDHPDAAFSVMPEEVYVPGDEVRFFDLSVDAVDYLWDFGDGNHSTEAHPVHEYTESGLYDVMLHVTNEYGCEDSTVIQGAVTAISKGFIKFPNAFRPRPDGGSSHQASETNILFRPVYRDVDSYEIQIYNRWGQLIYQSTDINEGWNGLYKGQLAPQAVYVWKVSGTFVNGEEFRETGSVLLVR